MLDYLIRYLSSPTPRNPRTFTSNAVFVQAIADKLEKDVNSLESKGRGVCTFKGLFYSRTLTSLWEHLECIDGHRSCTGQLLPLSTMVYHLERLCQWPIRSSQVRGDNADFDPHQFPTLIELLDSQLSASSAILEFIRAKSRREEIALDLWRDLFEDTPGSVPERKGPVAAELKTTALNGTIQDVHQDISRLHGALIQHLRSDLCHYPWRSMIANLESGQFNAKIEDSEAPHCFRLFLTNSHVNEDTQLDYWWQDVQLSIDRQTSVRLKEPMSMKNPITAQKTSSMAQHIEEISPEHPSRTKSLEDDDLCSVFQSRNLYQHSLTYSSCFERLRPCHPTRKFRQDSPSVPLSRLIGYGKLTIKTKAFLSSCLVRMLWQAYDSEWINENWSKDDIQFMLERSKDDVTVSAHEPFLQTYFTKHKGHLLLECTGTAKSSHNMRPHRYPTLLALGIMLLEIELDQSIEDLVQLDFHDPDPVNTKHIMALSVLGDKQLWPPKEIYSFLREVIELCVMPDYTKLEKTEDFRCNFLEEVVQPFDNFLVEAWSENHMTFPISLDAPSTAFCTPEQPLSIIQTTMSTGQPLTNTIAYTHDDYTVAWITALEIEMAVAQGMLDEVHRSLYQIEGDTNNYILGRLGLHKVVIACLPSVGNSNAAIVATNLLRSFCNVRIGLMVGIGGGVPAANDMRLGDIVVSSPTATHGGVIQYDFGTATQTVNSFTRKGHLNQPPTSILTAMKTMQAKALLHDYDLGKHFATMVRKHPKIGEQCKRPPEDRLYSEFHLHKIEENDCSQCGTAGLIDRELRPVTKVHYGIIGSGNEVIRDAALRDALHKRDNIVCFEMEAAGLMNHFPCIVIRGISDYCDSHKTKEWQPYAAGIAAAFAKELLLTISPMHVKVTLAASLTHNHEQQLVNSWNAI